ncbi:MAG: tetratricopeptide repeat protein [Pseudomonadota bacterium]
MPQTLTMLVLLVAAFIPSLLDARSFSDEDQNTVCDEVTPRVFEAAQNGDKEAQASAGHTIVSGDCAASQHAVQTAIAWLESAANERHLGAIVSLAIVYHTGEVVPANHAKAIGYYRQAAEADLVDAQHTLGVLLVASGKPKQREEGLYWLGAAATQGDGVSAAFLGMLHDKGLHGVAVDHCAALDWYEAGVLLDAPVPVQNFIRGLPDNVHAKC